VPDHVWQDIFEREWKSSRHLWDRKLFIVGDKVRLITTEEDFEEKLDWIENVINQTNKAIDEYNRGVAAAKEVEVRKAAWEERATIERLREILAKRFSLV
jgi:KaiC/GvpD/RAD55 family RecA-like ATPase